MASKDRARGKSLERFVAGRLGWRRRSNGEHGGFDDIVLPEGGLAPVSIECKAHAILQLRTAWVDQARQNSGKRPWAVVQRPLGWKEPVVTIGFNFFRELLEAASYTNHGEDDEEIDEGASAEGPGDRSHQGILGCGG